MKQAQFVSATTAQLDELVGLAKTRTAFSAAQAPLLHSDDTTAKILAISTERARLKAAGQTPEALAVNTSGIVAVVSHKHKVALSFTGHQHAGKNLADVLAQRARSLAAPIQMSDALACNFAGPLGTIVAKCLAHGRRKVVEVVEHFLQPCRHIIEVLAQVYAADAHCRDAALSPGLRLLHHQSHSAEPLKALNRWRREQFKQHLVEPNSGLGQALRYLLKHWTGLALFLRQQGAPLDNNVCERALKRAILHRKNLMFYKTRNGSEIGDIYISLISTCELCGVNPFNYLQALQGNAGDVMATPAQWLPWNFHEQLARPAGWSSTSGSRLCIYCAARLKVRQAGAARAWAGSPPMSSNCNSHACSTLASSHRARSEVRSRSRAGLLRCRPAWQAIRQIGDRHGRAGHHHRRPPGASSARHSPGEAPSTFGTGRVPWPCPPPPPTALSGYDHRTCGWRARH